MKRLIFMLLIIFTLTLPVSAAEYTAPLAPESAQPYMPLENETFSEGLWYIIKTALSKVRPELIDTSGLCFSVIIVTLLISILHTVTELSENVIRLIGVVGIGTILFSPLNSMIHLGSETIIELSDYSKLLLPIMTTTMAAQGSITASSSIYTSTALFVAILTNLISKIIIPALYIFLCLCIAGSAIPQDVLKKAKNFVKWGMTWALKIVLYVFTGYISISNIVSGAVDSSTVKAAKLTISGVVPVVGNIISDATETILISAGVIKNSIGIYGIFAILSVCIGPFIHIGIQCILLRISGLICNMFGYKPLSLLIDDFSTGMGYVLAMTGTVCIMLLISLVCFLRGIGL